MLAVLLLLPLAGARPIPDTNTTIDPDVVLSPPGCDDCYDVSIYVYQGIPFGCMDCPGLLILVGAEGELPGKPNSHTAYVCITGYSPFCPLNYV